MVRKYTYADMDIHGHFYCSMSLSLAYAVHTITFLQHDMAKMFF